MVSNYGYCFGVQAHVRPIGYRQMASFMESTPPDAPLAYDKTQGANDFQMLGNGPDPTLTVHNGRPLGDCGFVMTVNNAYVDSCETREPFVMPSSNEVATDYLRYNRGRDVGVINTQLFHYWRTVGLPWGGKLLGSAGLNFNDWDESWAYLYAFGGGCLAITVTESMEEQTAHGEPWDITGTPADHNVLGAHDVFVFARADAETGVLATWGQRQLFTKRWWQIHVQELDVTMTQEQAARHGNGYGVALDKLAAYMDGLNPDISLDRITSA